MSKSHSLNLYDIETSTEKFEIDVTDLKIDVKSDGAKPIVMNMALKLIDAVGGNIESVSTKLHAIDTSIAAGNAGSAAAAALVQLNVDAYVVSNNTLVATISNTVTANRAISDSNHAADAASRVLLETDMTALITAEETTRIADIATLTTSITTEVANRTSEDSAESATRAAADTALTVALAVETNRINAILAGSDVSLDSFLEVVNQYSTLNTSAIAEIASLNTALTALTLRVDELLDSN
jgi:hypothetical protein